MTGEAGKSGAARRPGLLSAPASLPARSLAVALAALVPVALHPPVAVAQSTWTGAGSNDFNDGASWDTSPQAPGAGDSAIIDSGVPVVVSSATVRTLDVSGGVLQVNADLTVTGGTDIFDLGRIEVQLGGELISDVTMTGGQFANSGTLTGNLLASGGTIVNDGLITGETFLDGASLTNNGTLRDLIIESGGIVTNNAAASVSGTARIVDGTLANNGTLNDVRNGAAGTFTNNSGATAATVTNAGTASNAGTIGSVTNTGGTFVNDGTITGDTVVSGGTLTNNFVITDVDVKAAGKFVNNTGATTGAVSNAGSITNAGIVTSLANTGGTFTNNNGGTVAGTTTVTGGTVTNNFVVTDVDVAAAGAFVNNSTGSAGAVTNAGTSSNDGTVASLSNTAGTFSNTGTITGAATITGGTVVNDGIIAGNVAIYTGGILSGTGAIGSLTVGNGGILSPGPGYATITVSGNVVFETGSVYRVDTDPSGLSDLLDVAGSVTINGGALEILSGNGIYELSQTYTIVTAGSLTGTFDEIITDLAFLTPDLTYGPTGITMDLDRNSVAFADVAGTANGRATAAAVEALGVTNPLFLAVLPLNAETADSAFRQLDGEAHVSLKSQLLQDSRFVRDAVLDRINGDVPQQPVGQGGLTAWMLGFGATGYTAGDGNASSVTGATGGLVAGADAEILEDTRLGALLGYSHASVGDALADSYHAGLYTSMDWGGLTFTGGAIYSRNQASSDRNVAFGTFADNLKAGYDSSATQVFGDLSMHFRADDIDLRPFANLAYIYLATDGFGERGGSAALTAGKSRDDIVMATLGLRWSADLPTEGLPVRLSGMVGWRHAMGDATPSTTFAFGSGSPFMIEGVTIPRNAAVVEAGLTTEISKSARLKLTYTGEFAHDLASHAARVDLVVDF